MRLLRFSSCFEVQQSSWPCVTNQAGRLFELPQTALMLLAAVQAWYQVLSPSSFLDVWVSVSVHLRPGRELQQQVAQLQAEYLRVGDQLESEQTRIMQVLPPHHLNLDTDSEHVNQLHLPAQPFMGLKLFRRQSQVMPCAGADPSVRGDRHAHVSCRLREMQRCCGRLLSSWLKGQRQ